MNPENNSQKTTDQNQTNKIETVDLNIKPVNNENQKPKKSGSLILIIILFLIFGAFILFLPTIDSYFKDFKIIGNGNANVNDDKNSNLSNGFIQIGKESHMTVSNIKFYNFAKKSNNKINFNYISSKKIADASNLNIFIEIYNSKETLIYRNKFNHFDKIERGIVKSYDFIIPEDVYRTATLAKAVIIDDAALKEAEETLLSCVSSITESNAKLSYEVNFYFKFNGLIRYDVNKKIMRDTEDEKYKKELDEEYNLVLDKAENVIKGDTSLSYTIDFETLNESDYTSLFPDFTLESTLKNTLTNQGWVCN